ncbi:MAG: hypothetical protein H7249_15345 [Chitinophagaceae bacterium]|nr:hypothetical protein [Oligoflexus sp.]
MLTRHFRLLTLALILCTATSGCKPTAEGGSSELMGLSSGTGASTAVDPVTAFGVNYAEVPLIFNLARTIRTKAPTYAGYIASNDAAIFVTSDKGSAVTKHALARKLHLSNALADVKTEKFRAETNFKVSTTPLKSEMTAMWYLDAFILEGVVALTAQSHTVEVTTYGSWTKGNSGIASFAIKGFGLTNYMKMLSQANPSLTFPVTTYKFTKGTLPIFGIPKLGVSSGVAFWGAIGSKLSLDATSKTGIVVSFVPDVSFGATLVAAKVDAGFASAEAGGKITLIRAMFPITLAMGAREGTKCHYANFVYETPAITLVQGSLYFLAKTSVPSLTVPSVIGNTFWTYIKGNTSIKVTLPSNKNEYQFLSVLWAPPDSLVTINLKGDVGMSEVGNTVSACDITPQLTAVTKDTAKDSGLQKTLGIAEIAQLKVMASKAKVKSCSKGATTKQ